jgi:hypothetical protein
MKGVVVTAAHTPKTLVGDLKTANANIFVRGTDTWLQPGTLIYESFPRLNNGPARCQLRESFKNISKIKPPPLTGGPVEINYSKTW